MLRRELNLIEESHVWGTKHRGYRKVAPLSCLKFACLGSIRAAYLTSRWGVSRCETGRARRAKACRARRSRLQLTTPRANRSRPLRISPALVRLVNGGGTFGVRPFLEANVTAPPTRWNGFRELGFRDRDEAGPGASSRSKYGLNLLLEAPSIGGTILSKRASVSIPWGTP
jgi:hypothetical protein